MNQNSKTIILACSSASNTGAYSDKVARKLMKEGNAKMLCLARFAVDKDFAETSKTELSHALELCCWTDVPLIAPKKF